MNLTRLGHYFVPTSSEGEEVAGSCRTALVVHVHSEDLVNLTVWNQDGGEEVRRSVRVGTPTVGWQHESFHLSMDCPWKR